MRRRVVKVAALCSIVVVTVLVYLQSAGWLLNTWLARQDTESLKPIAVAEQTQRDFGTTTAGPVLRADFSIRNDGQRQLVLIELSRSCACLLGGDREVVVDPGQSAHVALELHTARLQGRVRKIIRYLSNDPNLPNITLAVMADVRESAPDRTQQTVNR
jgi:hypothetical protein